MQQRIRFSSGFYLDTQHNRYNNENGNSEPTIPVPFVFFLSRLSSFLETQNMLIRTTFCSSTIHSSAILCSVYLISRHGIFGRLKNNISIIISIHEAINSVLRVIEQWFGHGIGCGSYSATASMHMVNVQG